MTKRRARGEGSVYLRKDGRCIGEYDDTNGKCRCVSGRTLAEVQAKLRKALADGEEGIAHGVSENLTRSVYLGIWLDSIRATVREYTYERHEILTRLHIVLTNQVGKPEDRHGFSSRRRKPLFKRAGLPPRTRFHALRHTCATLLRSQGINPKVISDMLGHSDVCFTLPVYAHVLPRCSGTPQTAWTVS